MIEITPITLRDDNRRGFTLAEITMVVLILSIISTLTVLYAARLGGHIHHPEIQIRNG